ncbi:hypothetical protein EDB92DRAFT_811734 [Lactarius akahatsu]|uniref:Uncharacterized protein n=1 Tax=Lactarius akahatsu TaxID=416441 RepID=A0AAD4LDY1_9AGAM|nr:hypothetical protein EDB92DRAFT_811734 [Lactarius akahatsu]
MLAMVTCRCRASGHRYDEVPLYPQRCKAFQEGQNTPLFPNAGDVKSSQGCRTRCSGTSSSQGAGLARRLRSWTLSCSATILTQLSLLYQHNRLRSPTRRRPGVLPNLPPRFIGYRHSVGEVHIPTSGEAGTVVCPGQGNENCQSGNSIIHTSILDHDGRYFAGVRMGKQYCPLGGTRARTGNLL